MSNKRKLFTKSAITLVVFYCSLAIPAAYADNYLDQLEAEAENMADTPAQEESSNWKPSDTGITDNLSPGLNKAGFEENLKHNFVGSYTFYSRLSDEDKATVYAAYQKNNDIKELTALIKQLSINSIEEK